MKSVQANDPQEPEKGVTLYWVLLIPAIVSFLVYCGKPPEPPVPPIGPEPMIVPEPDPSPTPRMWTCGTACDNQRKLGCELGEPTAEGSSCEEVCQNSQESPLIGLHWDVEALSNATTCE